MAISAQVVFFCSSMFSHPSRLPESTPSKISLDSALQDQSCITSENFRSRLAAALHQAAESGQLSAHLDSADFMQNLEQSPQTMQAFAVEMCAWLVEVQDTLNSTMERVNQKLEDTKRLAVLSGVAVNQKLEVEPQLKPGEGLNGFGLGAL